MPIIEIVLFGAGITIGGQRAWQRLKEDLGFAQKDSTAEQTNDTPGAPLSARSTAAERRGIQDFLDDVEYLVSPRARLCKPEETIFRGNGNDDSKQNFSPPTSPIASPRVGDADTPRDDPSVGSMWIASAINRLTAKLSPRNSQLESEFLSPEPKEKVAKAVRALAGENLRYVNRADEVKRAAACDWSPKSTPRQSAMKKLAGDSSPASTPRSGRRRIKWNEDVNVRNFVETSEELRSRREHWARILRHAEREACAAYVSNGRCDADLREHDAVHGPDVAYHAAQRDKPVPVEAYGVAGISNSIPARANGLSPWTLFPESPPSPPAAKPPSPPAASTLRPPSVPRLNLSSLPTPSGETSPRGSRSR
jgi:hypothetical protein